MSAYDWILVVMGTVPLVFGLVLLVVWVRDRPSPWYGRLHTGPFKGSLPLLQGSSSVIVGLSMLIRGLAGGA